MSTLLPNNWLWLPYIVIALCEHRGSEFDVIWIVDFIIIVSLNMWCSGICHRKRGRWAPPSFPLACAEVVLRLRRFQTFAEKASAHKPHASETTKSEVNAAFLHFSIGNCPRSLCKNKAFRHRRFSEFLNEKEWEKFRFIASLGKRIPVRPWPWVRCDVCCTYWYFWKCEIQNVAEEMFGSFDFHFA